MEPVDERQADDSLRLIVDGRTVGLARYGADRGLPVLALHGAPASRLMFDVADIPAKALGLTLYCPERPGYGLTPPDPTPTLTSRSDQLVGVADALGLERFALLGVSGGAPYAVAMAARLGERVAALGLVSPMGPVAEFAAAERHGDIDPSIGRLARGHRIFFLVMPKRKRFVSMQAALGARAFKAAPKAFAMVFAKLLSKADAKVLQQPHVEASLIAMTLEAIRQGAGGGVADLEIFSREWGVDYSAVRTPVVLWQGTADRIVPSAVSVWLSGLIPNCRLERLEGAGHFWVYDHVADVLGTLAGVARSNGL